MGILRKIFVKVVTKEFKHCNIIYECSIKEYEYDFNSSLEFIFCWCVYIHKVIKYINLLYFLVFYYFVHKYVDVGYYVGYVGWERIAGASLGILLRYSCAVRSVSQHFFRDLLMSRLTSNLATLWPSVIFLPCQMSCTLAFNFVKFVNYINCVPLVVYNCFSVYPCNS